METIVAAVAILLGILFSEIVQQRLAPADRTLGIGNRFLQQQLTDLLFGQRLALHEFFEFLNILITIKGQAVSSAAVAARAARLLIIAFEGLGNIVMDYITHVGLVDTHAESDRRDDHIDLLIQESILIRRTGNGIHAGMVRRHLDAVGGQQFGQLLDLFAAQAVDDSGFARITLDIADDLFGRIGLRTYLIKQIRPVERRFEHGRIEHTEVLLDIHLHLRRGRSGQRDQRGGTDIVDDRADAAVLRAEIVSPLGNTVRLVDGVKRYFDLPQKRHVVLLGQRLGCEIEQLGFAREHIALDFGNGSFVQR